MNAGKNLVIDEKTGRVVEQVTDLAKPPRFFLGAYRVRLERLKAVDTAQADLIEHRAQSSIRIEQALNRVRNIHKILALDTLRIDNEIDGILRDHEVRQAERAVSGERLAAEKAKYAADKEAAELRILQIQLQKKALLDALQGKAAAPASAPAPEPAPSEKTLRQRKLKEMQELINEELAETKSIKDNADIPEEMKAQLLEDMAAFYEEERKKLSRER
jgi:hypothetical protein